MGSIRSRKGKRIAFRYAAGTLAMTSAFLTTGLFTAIANTSSANFDMRRQVIDLTGIFKINDFTENVTRGEFARMLVNASSYRENLPSARASVFADVTSDNPNAVYIEIAASQGWIQGYLGGLFKPDEYITYKDAVRAILTILGYTDDDFIGDLTSSRISKFNYLELNEEVNRQSSEVLNQTDCMNIFYNLLKADKKGSSGIYGAVLGCELNSDGEINPISILEDERKGPILVRKGFSVAQSMPFDTDNANVFLNGVASTLSKVKTSQQEAGFAVIYYNAKSKTIWAYTTSGWDDDNLDGNNVYALIKGEIKNIYYKSSDVMTPTSITLEVDDDNSDGNFDDVSLDENGYLTITLDSSELQYVFSIYGSIEVGDEVVMVCNRNNGNYIAVDVIEY
ncbi:MAG: S-layer homology domain-containing protein [Enterocloster aldenensis]